MSLVNLSGYVGHVTIFSWMLTIVCCRVRVTVRFSVCLVSGYAHVFCTTFGCHYHTPSFDGVKVLCLLRYLVHLWCTTCIQWKWNFKEPPIQVGWCKSPVFVTLSCAFVMYNLYTMKVKLQGATHPGRTTPLHFFISFYGRKLLSGFSSSSYI